MREKRRKPNLPFLAICISGLKCACATQNGPGRLDSNRNVKGDFLPVHDISYSSFKSNCNHELSYLFVMQISPYVIILPWFVQFA